MLLPTAARSTSPAQVSPIAVALLGALIPLIEPLGLVGQMQLLGADAACVVAPHRNTISTTRVCPRFTPRSADVCTTCPAT